MNEYSIQEVLGEKNLNSKIYLVNNEENKPIYVGMTKSQSVSGRLAIHIADVFVRPKGGSLFSNHLLNNHPHYFNWKVKIYTADDISELTKNRSTCLKCAESALYEYLKEKSNAPFCNKVPPRKCKNMKAYGHCI